MSETIEIDTEFLGKLDYLDRDIDVAVKKTIKRVTRWIRSEIVKRVGEQLGLSVSSSKHRFKAYSRRGRSKLWLGLDDIDLHYFGDPYQDESGVSSQNRHIKSAFIDPMHSSKLLVWRRTTKKRLPIERIKNDISVKTVATLKKLEPMINDKFKSIFEQEIENAITRLL